jgi:hypothetical protein
MSYIGANPSQQLVTPAVDYFSGNGVTTTFTLSRPVTSVFSVVVVINGVEQNPRTAYTINQAGNIVFDGAPSAGTNNIYVMYNSQVGQFVTPSPGTVNTNALAEITNIRSGANNFTLQTSANNTTALTVDQNQNITAVGSVAVSNTGTFLNGRIGIGTVSPTVSLDAGSRTDGFRLPVGTIAQRPASVAGSFRYNSQLAALEFYAGGAVNSWVTVGAKDGSSPSAAAPSGNYLAQNFPGVLTSGYYWIQSPLMPAPLRMYVDLTQEGGGYDFFPITGGIAFSDVNATHSGTPLGLDLVMPRSKQHWIAMRNFVSNVLGSGDLTYFANVPGIYRSTGSGSYVSFIMRNPTSYGSGAPDWRVKDGGRWWLRDTTYSEPNGDYTLNGFLGDMARGGFGTGYAGGDLLFNDGGTYTTGPNYLVSTNAKP